MRWTSRASLWFLLPAVVWVLVFTILPICYAVYASLHDLEQETVMSREQVPMVDAEGNPMLRPDGTPRPRTQVTRETVTTW